MKKEANYDPALADFTKSYYSFFFIKNEKQALSLNNLSNCCGKIFKYKVSFDYKITLLRDLWVIRL
tara:strand:- start:534 stop:731 length:198 start_codon:yes stop_codon:yes gene_type:complete